jgi:hypothetical protein
MSERTEEVRPKWKKRAESSSHMSWKNKRKENIRGEKVPSIEEIHVLGIIFLKNSQIGCQILKKNTYFVRIQ